MSLLVTQLNSAHVGRQGALGKIRVAASEGARRCCRCADEKRGKVKPSEARAEDRKYSTAEGRRSGRSAGGGGEEPKEHTSSLSLC